MNMFKQYIAISLLAGMCSSNVHAVVDLKGLDYVYGAVAVIGIVGYTAGLYLSGSSLRNIYNQNFTFNKNNIAKLIGGVAMIFGSGAFIDSALPHQIINF